MGTHMQCQAVPLIKPDAPIIGTGMEEAVSVSMGRTIKARHDGVVEYIDANQIIVKLKKAVKGHDAQTSDLESVTIQGDKEIYQVQKFVRTSQSTCYSQKPVVKTGDKIKAGDVIIDGPSSDHGELALGANLIIAYTSFEERRYFKLYSN
jgi:DNA-directed RNA polymerase subunit beta